jgi:8-oxo-dGTP pyrophosphatase MutT (NUDIX family)
MRYHELFEKGPGTKTASTAWVILTTANKVILGKRAPSVNNPNQWNFFGGHIDAGESPIQAAIRELFEETGYQISPSALKELTTLGNCTYFSATVSDAGALSTTDEISKVRGFRVTDLPDNLHSKTENFFNHLVSLIQ